MPKLGGADPVFLDEIDQKMRLGKPIPTALKVKGNEAALFDDGTSQFEERKGAYDERVQAPQIYGKTKRED